MHPVPSIIPGSLNFRDLGWYNASPVFSYALKKLSSQLGITTRSLFNRTTNSPDAFLIPILRPPGTPTLVSFRINFISGYCSEKNCPLLSGELLSTTMISYGECVSRTIESIQGCRKFFPL